jgi:hypothetical protein
MDYLVVSMPSTYESSTGFIYMNLEDMHSEFVTIGNYVYRSLPHHQVQPGTVAMNIIQRRLANAKRVYVSPWKLPVSDFEIKDLSIEVEWLIHDTSNPSPDIETHFIDHFYRHVLTPGQEVFLYMKDNLVLCRIKTFKQGIVSRKTRVRINGDRQPIYQLPSN